MDINSKVALNNGVLMNLFGFGTFRLNSGSDCSNAVSWALDAGYRLIDTAMIYGNERDVGAAIKKSDVPREDLFVTTKLWNDDHGFEKTLKACDASLKRLGLSYVDLYLVHWPAEKLRNETWKAMEKLCKDGKCRAIGVSNYTIRHLDELLFGCDIVPAVNQVEFHPFLYQKDLLEYCRKHAIQLEAYRSLLNGKRLDDKRIVKIAGKHAKTSAQILLRWALQHEIVIIPKSKTKKRIIENSQIFDFSLSKQEMAVLDDMNENYRTGWDPSDAP